ncbi:MAG: HAD-IB family hydrolase [Gammaproteobacteria bacterium]|nr:HAD-IB family hydrolase [Gammaproteobacteria bacterium]
MALAIFDLDNTLLNGDSDHAWGEFLVEKKIVDAEHYARSNNDFYRDYQQGSLDINAYLNFCLEVLSQHPLQQLQQWRSQFIEEKIKPMQLPRAHTLIEKHRSAGDTLLIITATNHFVTAPIAELLNINHLLASEAEFIDGAYTGKPTGIPCYQSGKISRLETWLKQTKLSLKNSTFYSDSHNDLPLLEKVDQPVAIDPDPQLHEIATARGWPVRSLRET